MEQMTAEEAWGVMERGGVVTSSGYIYAKNVYFSWGTYPLCICGGDTDPRASCHKGKFWRELTFKESAVQNGYSPDYGNYPDSLWKDCYDEKRALGNWLKKRMTVEDYISPTKRNEDSCVSILPILRCYVQSQVLFHPQLHCMTVHFSFSQLCGVGRPYPFCRIAPHNINITIKQNAMKYATMFLTEPPPLVA